MKKIVILFFVLAQGCDKQSKVCTCESASEIEQKISDLKDRIEDLAFKSSMRDVDDASALLRLREAIASCNGSVQKCMREYSVY